MCWFNKWQHVSALSPHGWRFSRMVRASTKVSCISEGNDALLQQFDRSGFLHRPHNGLCHYMHVNATRNKDELNSSGAMFPVWQRSGSWESWSGPQSSLLLCSSFCCAWAVDMIITTHYANKRQQASTSLTVLSLCIEQPRFSVSVLLFY